MFTEFDRLAMTRALALAERGLETTHPNPRVGCVIARDDRIIAEGWHERAGEAHAEVAAIRSAKEPVAGATAYVTLEPCSHHGRTPPCVNALIEARIARVVFAVQDPNPRVSGQGADALLRAGITVEAGLMQAEATELNIGFMKRMREGLPWVRVKLAMSLDGRTALANGASQWITSESARADVQRWRARCSAVMTGVGTVLSDDPQLNVRTAGFKGRQPLRVVLDARLRSPVGAKMFVGLGGGGSGAAGAAGSAGVAAARAGGGAAVGSAAGGAAGSLGGDVLIFTAAGGGLSAAGPTRSAAPVNPSTLAGDLAELVNAFETSPTSVAARSADLAGPVSVKSETPASGVAAPTAAAGAPVSAGAPVGAAHAGSVGAGVPAANEGAVAASAPPILAAAVSAAGVAPTADDATWAGAALSGAVPVKSEAKTGTDGNGAAAVSDVSAPPSMYGSLAPPMAAASKAAPIVTGEGPASTPATVAAAPGSIPGTAASVAHAAAPPEPAGAKPTPATAANGSASTTPWPAPAAAHGSATLARAPAPAGHGPAASGATAAPPAPPPAPVPLGANARAAAATPAPATTTTPPASPAPGASTPAAASANQRPAAQVTAPAVKPTPKPDSPGAFQTRRAALAARGVRIEEVAADEGFLDLFAVLKRLGELEVNEVLVEAGPTLAGQLLTTFFADELLLYIAPKLLGPQGRPLVNLPELQSLQDAWGFSLFDAKRFGDDLRLRMRPK